MLHCQALATFGLSLGYYVMLIKFSQLGVPLIHSCPHIFTRCWMDGQWDAQDLQFPFKWTCPWRKLKKSWSNVCGRHKGKRTAVGPEG